MIITDLFESHQQCPECGGPAFSDLILAEKKDACYYKVKASAKVWPSAYASGRLVQCRKKGADNYGKSKNEGVAEGAEQDYLSQIPNLTWKPVSRGVWNTIQDEGLDEEQDAPKHTDWVMASLSIDPKDARALQAFDNDAIEDFNRFDIHLKSRYPGLTDLIDYDRGTVTIVKPIQMQGVAEGAKEDMSKEAKAMASGKCPHCHGPVEKKEHPTLTQYHCAKCGIRASIDKQGVAEAQLDEKCWDGYQQQGMKNKGGRQVPNCVPAESVNEMDKSQTPPGRDGSNDSDADKKEYTAKPTTAKKVAKDAEKILNKELNKKKGMAEGFPHDVDHMPGPVIRNADMTTDNVKTRDKAEWDRATDSINARVFDDMSEFRTDSKGETVIGDSAVWAKWDNATQTGWFNAKGRPLKPWPVKEQGVAEDQLDEKSTSQAQFRIMAAAAHNPKFAKKVGISPAVAKEFHGADRKQDYTDLPKKADESKSAPKEKEADYGDDYQAMVARVKKLAGMGPMKTVYDPQKRVYRNVPTAVQPKK